MLERIERKIPVSLKKMKIVPIKISGGVI